MHKTKIALSAFAALLYTGCASTTTSTPPPPQVSVLQYANLATAAGDTAARELAALCLSTPAQLDLVTCNKVKTQLLAIKSVVDQVTGEANKVSTVTPLPPGTETWATARANIAAIGATAIANVATGNTTLDSDISALTAFIKQITGVQ
jgi:hypothetical protein